MSNETDRRRARAESNNPFAAAPAYRAAGWIGTLFVPYKAKGNPPKDYTGYNGKYPSDEMVARKIENAAAVGRMYNIVLRMSDGVIGIDVDDYDDRHGGDTLAMLEATFGKLPDGPRSSSRGFDGKSGIRFFRVPVGTRFPGVAGPGIEIVQFFHRYAIVWPSIHPQGRRYEWESGKIPRVDELPELPQAWVEGLQAIGKIGTGKDESEAGLASKEAVEEFIEQARTGEPCRYVEKLATRIQASASREYGSAYDHVRNDVLALIEAAYQGHRGVPDVLTAGRSAYIAGVADSRTRETARSEWKRFARGALMMKLAHGRAMESVCVCDEPAKVQSNPENPFGAGVVLTDEELSAVKAEESEDFGIAQAGGFNESLNPETGGSNGSDGGSVEMGEAISPGDWDRGGFTDRWLAENFALNVCADGFCWSAGLGWLGWDGTRWAGCPEERVLEMVGRWARAKLAERVRRGDLDGPKHKGWKALLTSARRQKDVVLLARGIVEREATAFDAHPDLLNCRNGVVDLRTGELMAHDSALLMTKITGASYRVGARHADWDKALEAIPDDVRDWMAIRYGQAITGHMVPDDKLVIQYGAGENGKTSIFIGIAGALGDYYRLLSDRVLIANPGDHPTELMDLRGTRVALVEETPEARRLNVQRLKKIVGTPHVTARYIRRDSVTFAATHSVFLSTNYKPSVEETDHGTWRRLALVTFPYIYRKPGEPLESEYDRVGDPGLRDRISAGLDGQREAVLAWMVAGAMRWYAARRVMPAVPIRVEADTREWQRESDQVLAYIDDRLEFRNDRHVMAGDLITDLNTWLESHGHKAWSAKLIVSRLSGHDIFRNHRIEHGKARSDQKDIGTLSRPSADETWTHLSTAPNQYRAWFGVGFSGSDSGVDSKLTNDPENPF
jgi:putative DNA primase/helicase